MSLRAPCWTSRTAFPRRVVPDPAVERLTRNDRQRIGHDAAHLRTSSRGTPRNRSRRAQNTGGVTVDWRQAGNTRRDRQA